MLQKRELNELAARKQLLVLESSLNRELIMAQWQDLRAQLRPDNLPRLPFSGTWLVAGSALAGLLAVRHRRTWIRWMPMVFAGWRWFRKRRRPAGFSGTEQR
jgi:hypothetical protein